MCICVCVYLYMCMYVYVHMCVCAHACVHVYICMYVCMYVCMFVCAYCSWFYLVSETFIKAYTWQKRCGSISFKIDSQTTKDILLQWEDEYFKWGGLLSTFRLLALSLVILKAEGIYRPYRVHCVLVLFGFFSDHQDNYKLSSTSSGRGSHYC